MTLLATAEPISFLTASPASPVSVLANERVFVRELMAMGAVCGHVLAGAHFGIVRFSGWRVRTLGFWLQPKRLADTPSPCQSPFEGVVVDAKLVGPIENAEFSAIDFVKFYRPLVARLLSARRPFAVARFIALGCVFSIYRVSGWARPHVGQPVVKTVPALTNLDANRAVVLPANVVRLFASSYHAIPERVERVLGAASAWASHALVPTKHIRHLSTFVEKVA